MNCSCFRCHFLVLPVLICLLGCHRSTDGTAPPSEEQASADAATIASAPDRVQVDAGSSRSEGGVVDRPREKPFQPADRTEVDALFAQATVLRIDLEIPRAGINALRRTGWGNGQERPTTKATVRENGDLYQNVSVHLKGAAGSFRSIDDKPSMTLNFDANVPGQRFHGLNKISLNNSVQDHSFLCEKIGREMFIAAGVPVPRATHALVTLNGRDLGLYVLLEGANKQFLKHYFANAKGNLYDGGFCQDVDSSLAVNCGENPNNHAGLNSLRSALRERRLTYSRLEQVLDTERFLSMMAIEVMLAHWDGYTLNRNNWRVFHDLGANRMVFIPHGMDQLFGAGRPFEEDSPLIPQQISGDVSRTVLAFPEGRRRYRERFGQLYTNVFDSEQLQSRVDELSAGLKSALAQSHPDLATGLQRYANRLKQRIRARSEGLRRQLGIRISPLSLEPSGTLDLTGWKPETRSGDPTLNQFKDASGRTVLLIRAGTNGTSSASWRARAVLGPGQYQLDGKVRVSGVTVEAADSRSGAGVRISKGSMPKKLTGSSPWKECRYEFAVEGDAAEVEFICELKATGGEAHFDASSLRLTRRQ